MSFDSKSPAPPAESTPPATPKKKNILFYVLLGLGIVLLLICAGCGGLFYMLANTTNALVKEHITPQLQADPVIQQYIGQLSDVETSLKDAFVEVQKNGARHRGRTVCIKVKGDKGEGLVMCRLDYGDSLTPRAVNGELVLPNGEFHKLSE